MDSITNGIIFLSLHTSMTVLDLGKYSLDPSGDDYSYDVETFINFLVYPYFYREDNIKGWCNIECDGGCAKCPDTDLRVLYEKVSRPKYSIHKLYRKSQKTICSSVHDQLQRVLRIL